jgi:adenylosuccinate synthase
MKVDVLLGLQWGDEGKGKIVDVLTPQYDIIARFQGGPNAGHTLEFEKQKHVLRSIPSGIFQGNKINLIGNGVVLDPLEFMKECNELQQNAGINNLPNRLLISGKTHLILPTHRMLDAAYETLKGNNKIGTTGRGIGPTYADKTARAGIRAADILNNFQELYQAAKSRHLRMLQSLDYPTNHIPSENEWLQAIEYLKQFNIVESEYYLNNALAQGQTILAEGAQGTLLDLDFGSYPYVTSSNTISAGCCAGLGIPPKAIGHVYGIFKAYCTRVGSGPFPTELDNQTGDDICRLGNEYGSVTGRRRRCGWIDLVALKYSIMINGVTRLIMMKSDVLDAFPTIQACTAYQINGRQTTNFPQQIAPNLQPIYATLPGWQTPMTHITHESQFPPAFSSYVAFLENQLGLPIHIISTGPNRSQTIFRNLTQ